MSTYVLQFVKLHISANIKVFIVIVNVYYLANPAAAWQVLTGSGAEKELHN